MRKGKLSLRTMLVIGLITIASVSAISMQAAAPERELTPETLSNNGSPVSVNTKSSSVTPNENCGEEAYRCFSMWII